MSPSSKHSLAFPVTDVVQSVAINYMSDDEVFSSQVKPEPATVETTHVSRKSKLNVKPEPLSAAASFSELVASDVSTLPEFARSTWGTHFLPMLYNCLGSAADPFFIEGNILKLIQEIHDYAYPDSDYQVRSNDRIFAMVSLLSFY